MNRWEMFGKAMGGAYETFVRVRKLKQDRLDVITKELQDDYGLKVSGTWPPEKRGPKPTWIRPCSNSGPICRRMDSLPASTWPHSWHATTRRAAPHAVPLELAYFPNRLCRC